MKTLTLAFAPACRSIRATAAFPFQHAKNRGVHPDSSRASLLAPHCRRRRTTSPCPIWAHKWRGVVPASSRSSTGAQASSKRRATFRCPWWQARCSGVKCRSVAAPAVAPLLRRRDAIAGNPCGSRQRVLRTRCCAHATCRGRNGDGGITFNHSSCIQLLVSSSWKLFSRPAWLSPRCDVGIGRIPTING